MATRSCHSPAQNFPSYLKLRILVMACFKGPTRSASKGSLYGLHYFWWEIGGLSYFYLPKRNTFSSGCFHIFSLAAFRIFFPNFLFSAVWQWCILKCFSSYLSCLGFIELPGSAGWCHSLILSHYLFKYFFWPFSPPSAIPLTHKLGCLKLSYRFHMFFLNFILPTPPPFCFNLHSFYW